MIREYCPNCGEPVDSGLSDEMGTAPCENCETNVEPVDDPGEAAMEFKVKHPIRCTDCNESPQLVGLHTGQYTDGTIVACACTSLDSIPYELDEPYLPTNWTMDHTAVLHGDDMTDEPPEIGPEQETLA